jgi:hypothetical protein
MEAESSRDNYLCSRTLNPESKHDYPLELINSHVLEQAEDVKRHLRKK